MPKIFPADLAYERIYEWVMKRESDFISDKDKEMFDRWDFCDNQLRKYAKQKDVESMMKVKFPNISLTQIKLDIITTKRLFSSINTIDKDYEKLFLIEDIKDTMLEAKKTGDQNARTKAQKNLYLVMGFDKDDEMDLSKLEKHEYYLTVATKETVLKIDLMEMNKIPVTARQRISDFIESDITVEEAYHILIPELPNYEPEDTITE